VTVLVVNAGSSSLKLLVGALEELTALAPLHQPPALAALAALRRAAPQLPAVACFDTAFHAGLPDAAATYALPSAWRERWPLCRYGFHGLSHAWAARRAAALLDGAERIVSCHLGAGASLAAVRDGRSVDTTMGFTPLEGLVMATRAGDVDPGLLMWLLEQTDLSQARGGRGAGPRVGPPGPRGDPRHARGARRRGAWRAAGGPGARRLRASAAGGDRGDGGGAARLG
jgi:acetate kinase